MKLKKIASLMLAGIMAVSMLAACGEGKDNGGNAGSSSSQPTTTASGIAAALNARLGDAQKKVLSFNSDNKLSSALNEAVNALNAAGIEEVISDTDGLIDVSDWTSESAKEAVEALMGHYATVKPTIEPVTTGGAINVTSAANRNYMLVYKVNGSLNSAAEVAREVMDGTNGLQSVFYSASTAGTKDWAYNFSGVAEMVKVTSADGPSAYIVVVMIHQTAVNGTTQA